MAGSVSPSDASRAGDRYGSDVLAHDPRGSRGRHVVPVVDIEPEMVVECASSGWCGAVVSVEKGATGWSVVLEDRHGRRRPFPLEPAAFLLDGEVVTLRRAAAGVQAPVARTASGSVAVPSPRARVARDSRIWVEGTQDAELVERVWGDDLRVEGVVVEPLGGVDDLQQRLAQFRPGPGRRVGVLVDHRVDGSKESRIADDAMAAFPGVALVVGHPYVDVWQAIKPTSLGIDEWPSVPRGQPWKEGVCRRLGWPVDTGRAWRRILSAVRTYADLEPAFLGRVEELIDFVTGDG
ncbi:MAG: DUF3097 family protein [Actinomycetales bacterium]|nr:DUF3097 family protein [Actinomycetales bacterium]